MARESVIYVRAEHEHSPEATKRGYLLVELKAGKRVTA
jgi:hypothetical protein